MDPALKPMLCESTTSAPIASNAWFCEEKLDGWRIVAHKDQNDVVHVYGGRNAAEYTGQIPYIEAELAQLLPPDTVVDGELVGADWGTVQSAMTTNGASTPADGLRLVIFDVMRLCTRDIRRVPLEERRAGLEDPDAFPFDDCSYIDLSLMHAPLRQTHENLVAAGAEGTVWKRTNSPYTSGRRSANWVKWKHETTAEATCTGFIPGKGEFAGMIGAVEFELNGVRSTASGMDMATRQEMTADPQKWIGKLVEIKHNGVMKSGKPRHPQYLRLRSDRSAPIKRTPPPAGNPPARRRTSNKRWMRNYGAMGPDKLADSLAQLEGQYGDAYGRVLEHDGDLQEHIDVARRAALKKGMIP